MSRETDLAWASGFFDGEGCTGAGLSTKKQRTIQMRVTQKYPVLVHRFHEIVGVGKVSHLHYCSFWYTGRYDSVVLVVEMLWPYLGPIKRDQAEKSIRFYVGHKSNHSKYGKYFKLPEFL